MKTAAAAPRLHERHRARSRRRASGRGVGRTTAVPMRDGLPGVDLRLRDHRPQGPRPRSAMCCWEPRGSALPELDADLLQCASSISELRSIDDAT